MGAATEGIFRLDDYSRFVEQSPTLAWPTLGADDLLRTLPDGHYRLIDDSGVATARCSLWWTTVPAYQQERIGIIGHYAAHDWRASRSLLEFALNTLRSHGCTLAVGPMDGNTWERYRFVTESTGEPPFLLEPHQPSEWPQFFGLQGFVPLSHYHSAICDQLDDAEKRLLELERRIHRRYRNIRLRTLDAHNIERDLLSIHSMSLESFKDNLLHQPISPDAFLRQTQKILPFVDPRLVLLAEKAGQLVGYAFALPDYLQDTDGRSPTTLILKTLATSPHVRHLGLGTLLMYHINAVAVRNGYRRVIHALMHDDNGADRSSVRMRSHPIRGYTLFARRLI